MMEHDIPAEKPVRIFTRALVVSLVFLLGLICVLLTTLYFLSRPPSAFPLDSTIEIYEGMTVRDIVRKFAREQYVQSEDLLYAYLIFEHDARDIKAGVYSFTEPISVRGVAAIITEIGPSEPLLTLTFPEGITVQEMSRVAGERLANFSESTFISIATGYEGRLFPDTYFVPDSFTAEQLFDLLRKTYDEKTTALDFTDNPSNLTEAEVIIMASILEREANTPESMRLVSSVLQNRYVIDMPLQADASIEYVLDKPLSELTPEDLEIDSPYNTYKYVGLPPTPIGNPGLDAIEAVLAPTSSDYFFYITDPDGTFHFARDFDEHRQNIARYLR